MKRFLLFIAVLHLPAFVLHAQITIGQADMPSAGDSLRVSFSADTLNPAVTGANYTWNYSYLTPNAQYVDKFDNPSTFQPPFNLYALISSYGLKQYTPDSIPGSPIKVSSAYGFFKKSSTSLKEVGYGLFLNGLPVPFTYNPQDVVYKFPLNYGNKDSCDSKFAPAVSIGYYYGQNIHRVNVVDGWGTLTTPYGTFPTVRVKTTLAIRDTFADSSGVGYAISRPLQYEYKWLKQGGKIPYLQVNASLVAGNPVVTNIVYRDSVRAGTVQVAVNEVNASDFNMELFPNPANEYAIVQYTLNNSQDVRIDMLDINGKKITTIRNSKQSAGTHVEIIKFRDLNLSHGTYFVCLYAGNGRAVKKVVRE
jgi:hypothetical protein